MRRRSSGPRSPTWTWTSSARRFFDDHDGLNELLVEHGADPDLHSVQFVAADYTDDLALPIAAFDLLISLYAGFVSEHCTKHLRVGGYLLANPSHGDVAMASIDPRYRFWGVVVSRSGRYAVQTENLETYLIPKREVEITVERLHDIGRGVAYTKSPFAYLFQRVA